MIRRSVTNHPPANSQEEGPLKALLLALLGP
ncbi:hypothetical protein ABH940_000918 [Streptacidiphilus sp. BW17]